MRTIKLNAYGDYGMDQGIVVFKKIYKNRQNDSDLLLLTCLEYRENSMMNDTCMSENRK